MTLKYDDDEKAFKRISEIDAMFETATGWGSWMVGCANERESLVKRLKAKGHDLEHKHLARTASGGRFD